MNFDYTERTTLLLGAEAVEKLSHCSVAVFGIGGVGSYAAEALVRAGVGSLTLIDSEKIELSNINRQLFALHSTVGMPKTEAAALRLLDINPLLKLQTHCLYYTDNEVDITGFDYIADAIDSVRSKLTLIKKATESNVPVISSMGTGFRMNPAMLIVKDVYSTEGCPLARVMRHELRKLGIASLKVVCSEETPIRPDSSGGGRSPVASAAFVPGTAGLLMAAEIVNGLLRKN